MAKMIDLNCYTFIIHGQKDGMKLHLPLSWNPNNVFGLITYILTINKVSHNPTKNLMGNLTLIGI
jgi:hypothetical protein